MKSFYTLVGDRAGHRCEYCHAPELVFNFPFEVEHIIPIYRGGDSSESNFALARRSCNLRKGTRITGTDAEFSRAVRLFNPRQDQWAGHFQVDIASGKVIGITSIGRATIACLEVNSPTQLAARQLWIQLNLFP